MKRVPIRETRFGRLFEDAELSADYARRHAAHARKAGERFARSLKQRGLAPRRILDVGAGSGDTLSALAEAFPTAELVGVDLCEPLLEIAKGKASQAGLSDRVRFQYASATDLPFDDDTFDVVVSQDTLHMVDDPRQMLDECAQVLTPDGVALIRVIRRSRILALLEGVFKTGFTHAEVEDLVAGSTLRPAQVTAGLVYVTITFP